jgi:Xaa-Pro aminopeptidase
MAPTPTTDTVECSVTGSILRSGADDPPRESWRSPVEQEPTSFTPMDVRTAASEHDRILTKRLDEIVPDLMRRHGFEAWVIDAREYNEDPVARTMLPATWLDTARRRTILVFRDHGGERAAIARYPVGPFPAVWDPDSQPDQWAALAEYLTDVTGAVGMNVSERFSLGDGLTSTEHVALVRALAEHHVKPAEDLAIGWLETRLDEEVPVMAEACLIAHGFLRQALSNEVIDPGTTTTEDVAWWLAQTAHDSGYRTWFHPGVTVQRRGEAASTPTDGINDMVIERGDLMHIDFGIVRNGYHTDQQQQGYVLGIDESGPPDSFVDGMKKGNRLQDILMAEMSPGRSGNETLAATLGAARSEGIRPVVYTHPIGLHGHAAGSTIGLWDNQEKVVGEGDYPIGPNTGWSIELAVEFEVEEWAGQPAKIMLEENAFLGPKGVSFLDGRQEELWLIE